MAKPLLKIQRYFRRKPVRFFSLILLYLTAGSLVFLHSGFVGDSGPGGRGGRDSLVASEMGGRTSMSDTRGLGIMSRVFKETRRSGRRYGPPWMKKDRREGQDTLRRQGDYTNNWNRALKGRSAKDVDDGRGGLHHDFFTLLLQCFCFQLGSFPNPTTDLLPLLEIQNELINYRRWSTFALDFSHLKKNLA